MTVPVVRFCCLDSDYATVVSVDPHPADISQRPPAPNPQQSTILPSPSSPTSHSQHAAFQFPSQMLPTILPPPTTGMVLPPLSTGPCLRRSAETVQRPAAEAVWLPPAEACVTPAVEACLPPAVLQPDVVTPSPLRIESRDAMPTTPLLPSADQQDGYGLAQVNTRQQAVVAPRIGTLSFKNNNLFH